MPTRYPMREEWKWPSQRINPEGLRVEIMGEKPRVIAVSPYLPADMLVLRDNGGVRYLKTNDGNVIVVCNGVLSAN